jgi:broad specificity phosphatase PhoE
VLRELWLIRHGETVWSRSGAHTGHSDIPLTENGVRQAAAIGTYLSRRPFAMVLTSPLQRASETCRLAGYGEVACIEPNLREWDYGDYEGRKTDEIRRDAPGWSIWTSPIPGGETIDQVADRARSAIAKALKADGDVALFAHGHLLRILAACWLELPPTRGQSLALETASLSTLGYERETRVISRWNLSVSE